MHLDRIHSSSSFSDSGHDKRRQEDKHKKKSSSSSKKSLLVDMNRVLREKAFPYTIIEKSGTFFYVDSKTSQIVGRVDEKFINSLKDRIKAASLETEAKLTYDTESPLGDHLDLEI